MGSLQEDQCTFFVISCSVLLRMKNVSVKVVEKVETHVWCSVTLFWKLCHLLDIVEKYCRVGQATDNNMAHAHFMLDI